MFKFLMLGLLSCFLISGFTLAEDKPTEGLDKEKIIAVIDAQLEAFRSGDAEKAIFCYTRHSTAISKFCDFYADGHEWI